MRIIIHRDSRCQIVSSHFSLSGRTQSVTSSHYAKWLAKEKKHISTTNFKANLHKTLIYEINNIIQTGEQGGKTSYTYVHLPRFTLCRAAVVNKLLRPELTKTNQIWAEDICISRGTGLDLEVISYEPVLGRRQCNVSVSSTFKWSATPAPVCFSTPDRRRREHAAAAALQTCEVRGVKHLGMGFNPGMGAQSAPVRNTERDRWEKFTAGADTNSESEACIRVRLAEITLSARFPTGAERRASPANKATVSWLLGTLAAITMTFIISATLITTRRRRPSPGQRTARESVKESVKVWARACAVMYSDHVWKCSLCSDA